MARAQRVSLEAVRSVGLLATVALGFEDDYEDRRALEPDNSRGDDARVRVCVHLRVGLFDMLNEVEA